MSITYSSKFALESGWRAAKYLCSNADGSLLFAIITLTAGGEKFVIFARVGDGYNKRFESNLAYVSNGIYCNASGRRVAIINASNATMRLVLYAISAIGSASYITTIFQTSSTYFARRAQFTNSKLFVSKRQNEFAVYDLSGNLIENVAYESIFYNDSFSNFYAIDDNALICTRVHYYGDLGQYTYVNPRLAYLYKSGSDWLEMPNPIFNGIPEAPYPETNKEGHLLVSPKFEYGGDHYFYLNDGTLPLLMLPDGGSRYDGTDYVPIDNEGLYRYNFPPANNCRNYDFAPNSYIVCCAKYGASLTPSIVIIPPDTVNTPESLAKISAIELTGVPSSITDIEEYCVCTCGDLIAVSSKYTSEIYLLKYASSAPYRFIPHDWIAVGENDFECAFDIDISLNPVYFSTDADHNGIAIKARSLLIDNPNGSRVVVLINKRKIYIGANSTALISLHGADYVEFEQLNGAVPLHITLSTADVGIDGISIDAYV